MAGGQDFQVQVHIVEARDLKGRESGGVSDPVCTVTVHGKKEHTAVHKRTMNCVFDHLMFFQYTEMDEAEFLAGTVNIAVYDANAIRRNVLIGAFTFGLEDTYRQEGHEFYRRWVALTDTTGAFEGVQGYLKVSVVVLGPNDRQVPHTEEDDSDEAEGVDLQKLVLTPPSIKTEEYYLVIGAYRAEDLPKLDQLGSCDPFVSCEFAGNPVCKTKVMKKTLTPTWNQELRIPVIVPTMSDRIVVKLWDWDQQTENDLISCIKFRWSEVLEKPTGPTWYPMYGTDSTDSDGIHRKMNEGIVEGTAYRGRVLLSLKAERAEAPVLQVKDIGGVSNPPIDSYTLRLDVYHGSEVSKMSDRTYVVARMGPNVFKGKAEKNQRGLVSWHYAFDEAKMSFPQNAPSSIPDLMLQFYDKERLGKDERFGYVRLSTSEITGWDNEPRWINMNVDPLHPVGKEDVPGSLLFRANFGPSSTAPPRKPLQVPQTGAYELRAHLFVARNLPAGDESGLSDPYPMVRLAGQSKKGKKQEKTNSPQWFETITMNVTLLQPLVLAPDVAVLVYDWDQLSADDLIGRFTVPCNRLLDQYVDPTWYPLHMRDPAVTDGEVLASFQLIPAEQAKNVPIPDIRPELKNYVVEISAVGVRKMLPYKWLKVSNPWTHFDVGGVEEAKTHAARGPNGNFLEVVEVAAKMPTNPLYLPSLNIKVHDRRFGGASNPMVGTCTVDIGDIITGKDAAMRGQIQEGAMTSITAAGPSTPRSPVSVPGTPHIEAARRSSDKTPLLFDQDAGAHVSLHVSEMGRTLPDVSETVIGGEEPEEEPKAERPTVNHELENDLRDRPFSMYDLFRGRVRGGGRKTTSTTRLAGHFKGRVRVMDQSQRAKFAPPMNLKAILQPTPWVIRAYVLRAQNIVPSDVGGSSDPYMIIKCGDKTINDRQNVKKKTLNPAIFQCYEMETVLPGDNELVLQVWDWDRASKDDMIGETIIDLEDRLFSDEWKSMKRKPIEFRTLRSKTSHASQGLLEMWLEIMTPEEAARTPQENISPPAEENFELRVIVWNTKEVPFKDKKKVDVFCRGLLENQETQKTDVHWNSEDGQGFFNWRMKWPVILPTQVPRLKLQVWDQDLLESNDVIAEANLSLKGVFKRAYKQKKSQTIPKGWLSMSHPNVPGPQGQIEVSIELLTEEEARLKPAGLGRGEPNSNPHLPPPPRPETSFNPFRIDKLLMLKWKQNRWKVYLCLFIVILIVVVVPIANYL